MDEELISIIIPSFNREHLIGETLDSVLAQTYQNWECIVVDDRSTDGTQEKIYEYFQKDKRIYFTVNQRKKGAQGARNTGINVSKGKWIVFFDSDDYMFPDFIENLFNQAILAKADVCTCFVNVLRAGKGDILEVNNSICDQSTHLKILSGKCYVTNINSIIKKEKLIEIGLLDEECPSHQEKDTHIRLSRISKYTTVQKSLVSYYTGASDTISADRKKEIEGHLYILSKYKFYWRYKFYRGFINSAKRIRTIIYSNTQLSLLKYIMKLYLIAPELILLSLRNTIREKIK